MCSEYILKVCLLTFVFVMLIGRHNEVQAGRVPRSTEWAKNYRSYATCEFGICLVAEDYPAEKISQLMQDRENIKLFGHILNATFDSSFLDNRDTFDIDGMLKPLCKSKLTRTFKPLVMRNKENIWKYVVNVGDYTQTFSSELCSEYANAHESNLLRSSEKKKESTELCSKIFKQSCQQSFQDMHLLVYENGKIDFSQFSLPTTCDCLTE